MQVKLYLYHEQWAYDEKAQIIPWHIKFDDEVSTNRVRIFIKEVTVDIEDTNPLEKEVIRQAMIDGFVKQKQEIQAEAHMKIKDIEEKIQNRLAIEHKESE